MITALSLKRISDRSKGIELYTAAPINHLFRQDRLPVRHREHRTAVTTLHSIAHRPPSRERPANDRKERTQVGQRLAEARAQASNYRRHRASRTSIRAVYEFQRLQRVRIAGTAL